VDYTGTRKVTFAKVIEITRGTEIGGLTKRRKEGNKEG
jgi:hypothetical protein